MKSTAPTGKSTRFSSSGKGSNPSGKMRRIKMEEGSFFKCQSPSPTKNKSTKPSHSSWSGRPSREARKWTVSASSHQNSRKPTATESKSGPISMNQTRSPSPTTKTSSSSWWRTSTSKWRESISVKWRAKVLLSNPREKENDSWNDYICKYCNPKHLLNITSMD